MSVFSVLSASARRTNGRRWEVVVEMITWLRLSALLSHSSVLGENWPEKILRVCVWGILRVVR